MKRILIALGVVLASSFASSLASAQEAYFGVRFGFPFLIGLQRGLDLGERGEGLGLRAFAEATFAGSAGVFNLSGDVYNRLRVTDDGSNDVGVGVGLVGAGAFGTGSGTAFDTHFMAGFEFRLSPGFGLFLELTPIWVVFPSGASPQFITFPFFALGGTFRF